MSRYYFFYYSEDFILAGHGHFQWISFLLLWDWYLFFTGTFLVIETTILFSKFGQGTVAHWDPPKNLVISGVYRYMRNPMILGILLTVFGEIVIFGTLSLVPYLLFLLFGHHLLFTKYEEPELTHRFGENYTIYMKNVPRWIPRIKPWEGLKSEDSKIKK